MDTSTATNLTAVDVRLAALETAARRWRAVAAGLLLAGAMAAGLAAGQSPARAQAPAAAAAPATVRWQVVPLRDAAGGAVLVDTHTGDTWGSVGTPSQWRPMKR